MVLTWVPLNITGTYIVDNDVTPKFAKHTATSGSEAGYCYSSTSMTLGSITNIESGSATSQTLQIGFTNFTADDPTDEQPRSQSYLDERALVYGIQLRNDQTVRVVKNGDDSEGSFSYVTDDTFKIDMQATQILIYKNDVLAHTITDTPSGNYFVYFNSPYTFSEDTAGFVYANATSTTASIGTRLPPPPIVVAI